MRMRRHFYSSKDDWQSTACMGQVAARRGCGGSAKSAMCEDDAQQPHRNVPTLDKRRRDSLGLQIMRFSVDALLEENAIKCLGVLGVKWNVGFATAHDDFLALYAHQDAPLGRTVM